ncbi:MAG: glycosyltransferase family 39 protein [Bryobacteraceae bacterium]
MRRPLLLILAFVLLLRLPFLNQAVQGDDDIYLTGARHALIDPLHPNHANYIFRGEVVNMQGHPHPPLVSWILAALIAVFGDIREIPFHAVFALFTLMAALSTWSLAKRFTPRPLEATLLFLAVPAFVVNGNSFESDVPFTALWLAAVALFVKAVDENGNEKWLAAAGLAAALAAMTAYQAVLLTPILAIYVWLNRRHCKASWATTLAAPAMFVLYQVFERTTSGALPAQVLSGYLNSHGFQAAAQKLKSALALIVHFAWIVFPAILAFAARRIPKSVLALAGIAAAAGIFYDPNPLFWISLGIGLAGLAWIVTLLRRPDPQVHFLAAWVALFFAAACVLFFAGSARYLLPIAVPVAILVSRDLDRKWLLAGFAAQLALSLSLSAVSYQHWDGYRQFARELAPQAQSTRVWVNGEWGLRYYLEAEGALAMSKDQVARPGDVIATSLLSQAFPNEGLLAVTARRTITSPIPLRMNSLHGRSAFSVASSGLRPFDISLDEIDEVRAELVQERKATLESLRIGDPASAPQIIRGLFADGWTGGEVVVTLKRPAHPAAITATLNIPPAAAARRVEVLVDGVRVLDKTFEKPGVYSVATGVLPAQPGAATVTLRFDKTVRVPPDQRDLGVLLSEIGFVK